MNCMILQYSIKPGVSETPRAKKKGGGHILDQERERGKGEGSTPVSSSGGHTIKALERGRGRGGGGEYPGTHSPG